jgi:hypothetical protein
LLHGVVGLYYPINIQQLLLFKPFGHDLLLSQLFPYFSLLLIEFCDFYVLITLE